MKEGQSPIVFEFARLDAATRSAFDQYCEVELARARAAVEGEATKQRQIDVEARASDAEARRAFEEGAPRRLVEAAQAEAAAEKIRMQARLDAAKVDHEIQKLRVEGERLANFERVKTIEQVLNVAWPKVEVLGRGFHTLVKEENQATRDLLVANMHLLAGRNPKDGSK